MQTGTPEDLAALRDLVSLYCRGVDRGDFTLLAALFHPDARLDYGPGLYQGGLQGWLAAARQAVAGFQATHHNITNALFQVAGDTGAGESYFVAYHRLAAGAVPLYTAGGRYLDRFIRWQGQWRILERTALQDWETPEGGMAGVLIGQRGPQDLSYQRLPGFARGPG